MQSCAGASMCQAAVTTHDDGPQAAVAAHDDGPQAAVAVDSAGPEAAVAASPEDLARVKVTQPWSLNNVALKWIRDLCENPPGTPTRPRVNLTRFDTLPIGVIQKNSGMCCSFKANGETTPWSWRQMLAGMTADAKEAVLGSTPR